MSKRSVAKLIEFLQTYEEYVIMNGWENLERENGDIDIIVGSIDDFTDKFQNFASKAILVQNMNHHIGANHLVYRFHDYDEFLHLDMYESYVIGNKILFDYKSFSNACRVFNGLKIPSEFIYLSYYTTKSVIKKVFEKKKKDLVEVYKNVHEDLNPEKDKWLIDFFEKGDVDKSEVLRKGKDVGLYNLKELKRKILRVLKPTGIVICFMGPDGSGKSTVIEALESTNELPFRKREYYHFIPFKTKKRTVSNPHEKKPYNTLVSLGKLAYLIFKYNYGYYKNVFKAKRSSTLVIFDRYFEDMLIDQKRVRLNVTKVFVKLTQKFIPSPDIYFVLTAEAQVIYDRKQELELDEIKRQLSEMKKLNVKRKSLINVDRSVEEIRREIILEISNYMNRRLN